MAFSLFGDPEWPSGFLDLNYSVAETKTGLHLQLILFTLDLTQLQFLKVNCNLKFTYNFNKDYLMLK